MLKFIGRGLYVRIVIGNSYMIIMVVYIIYFKFYNYVKYLILSNFIKIKIYQKDFFGLLWNYIINL